MKNDLTCGVVRDLLPAYVEGLSGEETNQAIERHLAACAACASLRTKLDGPEERETGEAECRREVDYLRTIKRRAWHRVVLAVVCTLLIVGAGLLLKIFYIGTPVQPEGIAILSAEVSQDQILQLRITSVWSGTAYHSWKQEEKDGRVDLWARQVPVSPLHKSADATLRVDTENVREIYLCGQLVWQDGVVISPEVLQRYEARSAYVGDAPALSRLSRLLDVDALGPYTHRLHTSHQPYTWTVEFSRSCSPAQAQYLEDTMKNLLAPQMLALVGNLDAVQWSYREAAAEPGAPEVSRLGSLSAQEAAATWTPDGSIKDCAASCADFQRLYDLLTP